MEDKAIKLGNERTRLEDRLGKIIEEAVALMSDAGRNGVSVERLAERIQVSRPTLYRWRDSVAILRAERMDAIADQGRKGGRCGLNGYEISSICGQNVRKPSESSPTLASLPPRMPNP